MPQLDKTLQMSEKGVLRGKTPKKDIRRWANQV